MMNNIAWNGTFYLRFFANDLLQDFLEMEQLFNKQALQLDVVDVDGTYKVTVVEGQEDIWNIVFHKYLSYSKQVRKEGEEKFYPVICRESFIGVISRPKAV